MAVDFQPDQPSAPPKKPFSGVHFSHQKPSGGVLRGALRGSSPESSDAERVHVGRGAPAGVHVYRRGHVAHPHIKSRPHASGVEGNYAVADLAGNERGVWKRAFQDAYSAQLANGTDPQVAQLVARNEAEHTLLGLGYDGMENSQSQPGSVLLWGDVPISS